MHNRKLQVRLLGVGRPKNFIILILFDRCNSFQVVLLQTDSSTGYTTLAVNVTNYCADAFYYAAFSIEAPLKLIGWPASATKKPKAGTTAGTKEENSEKRSVTLVTNLIRSSPECQP